MERLIRTYHNLLKERTSPIRRSLLDELDRSNRLIAIKGSRGVGKTNFLLAYAREYHKDDASCLYVNINNLFLAKEGLFYFVERFYKRGGKVLLLDQIHKYVGWDEELEMCYEKFLGLQIIFTTSTIVRVKSNPHLSAYVAVYVLHGLSFREFIELQTGKKFPILSVDEIIKSHKQIATNILKDINPLKYLVDYLEYGYYPTYLDQKSNIDFLLKNINLTLEFDLPYINQIELKYLTKLKLLLYTVATFKQSGVNVSRLSTEIGVSRATIMNYLTYMHNARMLTLVYDRDGYDNNKKPKSVYLHNPNLLNALTLDIVNENALYKSFFLSHTRVLERVYNSDKAEFLLNEKYDIAVYTQKKVNTTQKNKNDIYAFDASLELGEGENIPLWLIGFVY